MFLASSVFFSSPLLFDHGFIISISWSHIKAVFVSRHNSQTCFPPQQKFPFTFDYKKITESKHTLVLLVLLLVCQSCIDSFMLKCKQVLSLCLYSSICVVFAVEDALAHPYLTSLHDISDEPVCMTPFSFDFEQHALTEEQMKELIYREAVAFNPEYQQ